MKVDDRFIASRPRADGLARPDEASGARFGADTTSVSSYEPAAAAALRTSLMRLSCHGFDDRVSALGQAHPVPRGQLLQCDELALDERSQIVPVEFVHCARIANGQQRSEFMWAQHVSLRGGRGESATKIGRARLAPASQIVAGGEMDAPARYAHGIRINL